LRLLVCGICVGRLQAKQPLMGRKAQSQTSGWRTTCRRKDRAGNQTSLPHSLAAA